MRFSELDGARVGVWGAGREISSLAEQLARRLPSATLAVAAFDDLPSTDVRAVLQAPELRIVTAAEAVEALSTCDVVVRSPGVSMHRPELRALRERGTPVTTATALWLAEREGRGVIGVTGTKGKSTTAALIFHLASGAAGAAQLAGNIGVPALDLLEQPPTDLAVVELSSYQIADLAIGPQVALITNLFSEHADWHGSQEAYHEDKLRIAGLPGVRATVFNARDPRLSAAAPELAAEELPLPGEHNALNLCGALAALEAFGVSPPPLRPSLASFDALPHRLQTVAERGGVLYVDDSISTTPESTIAALASFPDRPIVLIAGGQDRGQDHAELARVLAERAVAVIGVPTTGPRLLDAARAAGVPDSRAVGARDLEAALEAARSLAEDGAVILLSPAAPSYDSYRDFEERGERFGALATAG